MATLGLDTSAYERGIEETKSSTKQMVASLSKEYTDLQKQVNQTALKYNEQVKATGAASKESKELLTQLRSERERLAEVQQALNNADTYMKSFKDSTKGAASEQTGFVNSLVGAITKANLLSSVVQTAVGKVKDFAVNFVETGVQYNAQIEKYTTGFTNMLGSAEAAQQAMENIQQDAARTPFNVESLVSANQYLISAGENATYARKTIMALGDAVSATGGGSDELNRMAQNLQQIANVGKASSVDIKQFAMSGINIYQVLADYTGKSVQDVQNMTISYDLLSKSLIAASEEGGRYYNSMDTQSQTMNGQVSTLKDNVSQLAGLLTGDLTGALGTVISKLNEMVVAAQEGYKTDGWAGLGTAILNLDNPISHITKKFVDLGSSALTALDRASFTLNKLLGKDAYSGYDSYEDYKADKDHESNRERRRQDALAGKGISNQSWTKRQAAATAESSGSSVPTGGGGSSGSSKAKTITEKVISSQTDAATAYTQNDFGRVTTATSELTEKVLKSDGTAYDRFTKTVTESGKELVNGVVKNYKTITKTVTGEGGKVTSTTQKVYEDASKTLTSTLTRTAQSLVNGISTTVDTVTQLYADGSTQLVTTTTETGKRLVNGTLETYTKIRKIAEDGTETTSETSQAVVSQYDTLNSKYGEAAARVAELTALYNESVAATGDFSYQSKNLAGMLAEAETEMEDAKKALNEYEKTTNRAYVQTKKFTDLVKQTNSSFSDFGSKITALGEFFDSDLIQRTGDFFTTITDGVEKVLDLATSTATLVTTLQELKTTLDGIKTSGGVSSALSGIGKLLGIGGATAAAGTAASGAATAAGTSGLVATVTAGSATTGTATAAAGTTAAGTGLAALGLSIPQIGLIVAGVLGVAAVGYGIYKWATKDKDKTKKSDKLSYTDLQDAYWYGNERAFAGYDYRTDPYTFGTQQGPMKAYQDKMQTLVETMADYVEQYLPQAGNNSIVLDDGTLVGRMAPKMNAEMGQLAVLSGRGN